MRGPSHPCLSSISSQTTRGPHAPCGGQSSRSPGNRTHLGQLSLDRMGTPLRDPCALCCFLCNDQEALDEQPRCHPVTTCPGTQMDATRSPRVLEPRQSTWVLGDTGCFTNVGCVPNPRATPLFPGQKFITPHRTTAHLHLTQKRLFRSSFVQTQMTLYRVWKLDPE